MFITVLKKSLSEHKNGGLAWFYRNWQRLVKIVETFKQP
jgi:hypothetical protein